MLYVTHIYQSAHSIDGCGNQGGTADIDFVPYQGWSFFVLWKTFGISIEGQKGSGDGFFRIRNTLDRNHESEEKSE